MVEFFNQTPGLCAMGLAIVFVVFLAYLGDYFKEE